MSGTGEIVLVSGSALVLVSVLAHLLLRGLRGLWRRRSGRRGARLPARRRAPDPRVYLKAAVAVSLLALFVLPWSADALNLAVGPRTQDGCRVLRVVDGDTVTLWCPGRGAGRARLEGYDAPELFSPRCAGEYWRAQQATWALRRLLLGKTELAVAGRGIDRYGRRLVRMLADGQPVAAAMIAAGHGRPYSGGPRTGWC